MNWQLLCVAAAAMALNVAVADEVQRNVAQESLARYEKLMDFDSLLGLGNTALRWNEDGNRFRYSVGGGSNAQTYEVDVNDGARKVPVAASAVDAAAPRVIRDLFPSTAPRLLEARSPDERLFLTLEGPNLALRRASDDRVTALTRDGTAGFEWTTRGAKWSPDGRWLAAVQVDERGVHRVPVISWLGDDSEVHLQAYPQARGAFVQATLALVDTRGGKVTKLSTGSDEHFIAIVGFSRDSGVLRLLRMTRDHRRTDLMEADVRTGALRAVLSESSSTYLYGSEDVFADMRFYTPLQDGRFIWASERDGWNHLYLYDGNGRLLRRLTRGAAPVIDVRYVDERAGIVYFSAHSDARRPYDRHLLRVRLDGSDLRQLTHETGVHQVTFSPKGEYYVDLHSSVQRPPVLELRRAQGALLTTVERGDARNLYEMQWTPPEEFVVEAADGRTDLHGQLYKPIGFDPNKRYPVVQCIYAGPFKSIVPHGFRPSDDRVKFLQALAQLGFIGIVLDARGTPGRGKAFQDVAQASFGRHEIEDHAGALAQLAAVRPYMDLNRVGVFGISFGGYFTIRGMLQRPDLYRAGVALAPAEIDADVMGAAIEPFLGRPADNPAGYAAAANVSLASRFSGHLLLAAGTSDVNTPFAQTMKVAHALKQAGARPDMLVIPQANHLMRHADGSSSMRYVFDATRDYFIEHLRP